MCGIFGVWYFDRERPASEALVRDQTQRLAHRGPDAEGFHFEQSLGLGFRHLRIIDLDGSQQPIVNEDKSLWLVCNGEIYNAPALRRSLMERHDLYTAGDIEVILHLYEDQGIDVVRRLRGMFAFALWDRRQDEIILAVDRFGKKPLYYTVDHEKLIFSSELKAIAHFPQLDLHWDYEALDEYLACGYITAPRSIFRGIRKVCPGQVIQVGRDASPRRTTYWQPAFAVPERRDRRSFQDLAAELRALLTESVKLRLQSAVPVGAFLSGGVDSTAVVGLMTHLMHEPVKTFSLGFRDKAYDESTYALMAARYFQTDHHIEIVEPDALNLLPKLVQHFDEPFADSSMIPTYLVSKAARQHCGVVLSGDGGDEVFAGYHQHLYAWRQQFARSWFPEPVQPFFAKLFRSMPVMKKVVPYLTSKPARGWLSNGFFSAAQRRELYQPAFCEQVSLYAVERLQEAVFEAAEAYDVVAQLQYHDLRLYLPGDILVKVDRASMLNSLEVRCPLLDHVVFEFMSEVPASYRVGWMAGKRLLKAAVRPLLPPFVHQRKKQGFSIPQAEWLRGYLLPILKGMTHVNEFMERAYIDRLINEHVDGSVDHKDRLWALLCLELWIAEYKGQALL